LYKFMDNFQKNNTEEILESFKKYNGIVDANLVRKQTRGLVLASEKTKSMFAKNLNTLYAKGALGATRGSSPCLPLPEKRDGEITIGNLIQGPKQYGEMRLPVSQLCHSLIIGSTGMGKSTEAWNIIEQLVKLDCNVLVFDKRKEAVNIVREIPIPVIDASDLQENIFEPPIAEINPKLWISKILDLVSIWGLYWSSRNYIGEYVIDIYDETGEFPTLYDVFSTIKSENERGETRRRYQEASLNKLKNAVEELPMLCCKRSFPLDELFSTSLVIQTDKLSSQSERFLEAYLLLALVEIRKARSIRGNPAIDRDSIYVYSDESASLFNPQLDYSEKTSEVSFDMLQEIPFVARDYKICLLFSSQIVLGKNIMSNVRTKFVSQIPDAEDSWRIGNSIGVDPRIFQKLDVGEFVVKSGNMEPFLIKTKKVKRNPVDDKTLEDLKRPLVEYIKSKSVPLIKTTERRNDEAISLDEISKKMLINIACCPSFTVTQRYSCLSLNGRIAQDVKQSLIKQKLVEEVFLAIGSPKQSTFLVPTQKTIAYLRSVDEDYTKFYKHIGKTSAIHQLIQAMLLEYFVKNGWNVLNDYPVGDKFVDVYVEKEKKIIFEVAANPSIDTERVSSALQLVDYFVVLATDIAVLKNLEKTLNDLNSAKIKTYLATNYLAKLRTGVLDYYSENIVEQSNRKNDRIIPYIDVEQVKIRRKD